WLANATPSVVNAAVGPNTGGAARIGAFNCAYFSPGSSPSVTCPVGQAPLLYVAGTDSSGSAPNPTLWSIGFMSFPTMNGSGTQRTGLANSNNVPTSPVTEFFDGTNDFLFVSVNNACTLTGGGTAGCVGNFNINAAAPSFQ